MKNNNTTNNDSTTTITTEQDSSSSKADEQTIDEPQEVAMGNRKYNDYARAIAGLPQLEGSAIAGLDTTEYWKDYSKKIDESWSRIEKGRLSLMRAFKDTAFGEEANANKRVLYPFSGPDFLNVFTFYPKGKDYTMLALEKTGNFQDFENTSASQNKRYLEATHGALKDIFGKSFFITSYMGTQLAQNGVVPIVSLFMVRTGNTIIDIRSVSFDTEGNAIDDTTYAPKYPNANDHYAARIYFTTKDEPSVLRSLIYISGDASSKGLNKRPGVRAYLNNIKGANGYMKAASYVCMNEFMFEVRDIILNSCDFILQDDTGIPLRNVDTAVWDIQYFGEYELPTKSFDGYNAPIRHGKRLQEKGRKRLAFLFRLSLSIARTKLNVL